MPVFRQKAATNLDHAELCPTLREAGKGGSRAWSDKQAALFCSNHLVWQRVNESEHKPEFVVILEDDVIIQRDFAQRLEAFLQSDCGKDGPDGWDVLGVDTFFMTKMHLEKMGIVNKTTGKALIKNTQCNYVDPKHPSVHHQPENRWSYTTNAHGAGTHMVIYRTAALPKLLTSTGHIMDHYWLSKGRTRMWNPMIAVQRTSGGRHMDDPYQCRGGKEMKQGSMDGNSALQDYHRLQPGEHKQYKLHCPEEQQSS